MAVASKNIPAPDLVKPRRALLSVSDKTGIIDLARKLHDFGIDLISTGGTSKAIADAGLPVTDVSQVTGFPEIMDGRVKTLHPSIHGGLLAIRDDAEHQGAMTDHGITGIDIVIVNLYPFQQTIAREGVTVERARGNIDIGGPCMIRASAKNFIRVAPVVDPSDYGRIIADLKAGAGVTSLALRFELAKKAFEHTAEYDRAISDFLAAKGIDEVSGCYEL